LLEDEGSAIIRNVGTTIRYEVTYRKPRTQINAAVRTSNVAVNNNDNNMGMLSCMA